MTSRSPCTFPLCFVQIHLFSSFNHLPSSAGASELDPLHGCRCSHRYSDIRAVRHVGQPIHFHLHLHLVSLGVSSTSHPVACEIIQEIVSHLVSGDATLGIRHYLQDTEDEGGHRAGGAVASPWHRIRGPQRRWCGQGKARFLIESCFCASPECRRWARCHTNPTAQGPNAWQMGLSDANIVARLHVIALITRE